MLSIWISSWEMLLVKKARGAKRAKIKGERQERKEGIKRERGTEVVGGGRRDFAPPKIKTKKTEKQRRTWHRWSYSRSRCRLESLWKHERKRNPMIKMELFNHLNVAADLQWAMMGPASGGLQVFTLRRKARKGVGYSGTPWSGHAVNWNWRTSRFSLEPFCRSTRDNQVFLFFPPV